MTQLTHVATHAGGKAIFTTNVVDISFHLGGATPLVLMATNKGGGLSAYRLTDAQLPAIRAAERAYPDWGLQQHAASIQLVERPGGTAVVVSGQMGSVFSAATLSGTGSIGSFAATWTGAHWPGDLVAMEGVSLGASRWMLAGRDGRAELSLYRMDADGAARWVASSALSSRPAPAGAEIDALSTVAVGGKTYAISLSSRSDLIAVHEVTATGALRLAANVGDADQIGFAAPGAVGTGRVAGTDFVVVAGSGSDSLSVFRIDAGGRLTLADHVVDGLATRFQSVTALQVVELSGRVFVFAGGADDGITVLTLDPDGRLIELRTLADDHGMTLSDVSAIGAQVIGGRIALFVSSATEAGVTQLMFDPGSVGMTRAVSSGTLTGGSGDDILVARLGATALSGGAGDDILVARAGRVTLVGGAGSDRFVPSYGASHVVIADFDPARDQLDLSELAYIRSAAQLQVTPTSTGALLQAGTVRIEIRTVAGTTLSAGFFTDEMFRLGHYANDIDYARLVTPVVPTSPAPSSPAPAGALDRVSWAPPASFAPIAPTPHYDRFHRGTAQGELMRATPEGTALVGNGGNDTLVGSSGRDVLNGGDGDDLLLGGLADDLFVGGAGADTIKGGPGHDRVQAGPGNDVLYGEDGDDRLWGGDGADSIYGGAGNDVIYGQGGDNVATGGAGHDLIVAGTGSVRAWGNEGQDTLYAVGGGPGLIWGGPDDDVIWLNGPGKRAFGEAGNDRIYGGIRDDYIDGGKGRDLLGGGGGNDTLRGGDGHDSLYGHGGNDSLNGGAGDDLLSGGDGRDTLVGAAGNDVLKGNGHDDLLHGEGGDDLLYGGWGNDRLLAGAGDDRLFGEAGDDTLAGGLGNDHLSGGAGNDSLMGEAGDDHLDGGVGSDLLDGGAGRDRLFGHTGADRLLGGADNDLLDGGADDDHLDGGDGNDSLLGGAGRDTLIGGAGDDRLEGGAGADLLIGGLGADSFVFRTAADSAASAPDIIRGFQPGVDRIDLSGLHPRLVWIGSGAFSASAGEVRMISAPEGNYLLVDVTGNAAADMRLLIEGHSGITPFDLLF